MYVGHPVECRPIPMADFDPQKLAVLANGLLQSMEAPRRRQILANFRDHAMAECCGDFDALMATCSKKSQTYSFHTAVGDVVPAHDYDSLCVYYRGLVDSKTYLIDLDVEKLVVGEDTLCVEGVQHILYPGEVLNAMPELGNYDAQEVYQLAIRACVFFIFDEDGLGAGEQAYSAGMSDDLLSHVPKEKLPACYWTGPRRMADLIKDIPDWVTV